MNFKCLACVVLVTAVMLVCSCKKFIQIPPATGTLVGAQLFSDSADATAAVVGIYTQLNVGSFNYTIGSGAMTFYTALSSDELIPNSGVSDENEFYSNALTAIGNSTLQSVFWDGPYSLIYQTNACIEGLTNSKSLSESLKNQLIGECQLFRAMIYFNMVNLFGGVPLVGSTNYTVNESLPRANVDSVYTLIFWDLRCSVNMLGATYFTPGRYRPNKYTAEALLSKVYLFRGEWDSSSATANDVISSGVYSLEADPGDVFLTNSNEAIWQVLSANSGYETTEANLLMPSENNVEPTYLISGYLLSAFEVGDLRRTDWLDSNVVNGVSYYYPYKYKQGYDGGLSTQIEVYTVFRLAEQYLIQAEAMAELGEFAQADSAMNIIRGRAGLNKLEPDTKSSVIAAIMHERQIELFCEWGNRWLDLRRTNTVGQVLGVPGSEKPGWPSDGHAALYPIPNDQILLNPALVQNPGY